MLVFYISIRFTFLLALLMANKKTSKCKGDCGNDGTISKNECCSNYHLVGGICEVCPAGFFGTNCSVQCPPPSYGLFCGKHCNCSSSECNHINGCWHYESTTFIASTLESDTTFLSNPVTKDINTEISPYQRTLINDDKFIVVLSVTAVSSVMILLTLVITKLRCNRKRNIIYYTQGTKHHRPISMQHQIQVPFRNLETDVYMEIEEMDEIKEISNSSFKKLQSNKFGVIKGTSSDNLLKSKPDSLLMREKSSSRTNFNNTLEPKPDSFKQETKSVKKFEKYKTYTTRRLLYSRMNMKRCNSWHNVKDLPEILSSLKKAKSDLNIFHFKT